MKPNKWYLLVMLYTFALGAALSYRPPVIGPIPLPVQTGDTHVYKYSTVPTHQTLASEVTTSVVITGNQYFTPRYQSATNTLMTAQTANATTTSVAIISSSPELNRALNQTSNK